VNFKKGGHQGWGNAPVKFRKMRCRYEYSGLLKQEKYKKKPNWLTFALIFVRKSKRLWAMPAVMAALGRLM